MVQDAEKAKTCHFIQHTTASMKAKVHIYNLHPDLQRRDADMAKISVCCMHYNSFKVGNVFLFFWPPGICHE